jgi:uncharacterized protein (TIGR02231 family)
LNVPQGEKGGGVEASITAVTVFADGARVTRAGEMALRPGRQSVEFAGLPSAIDPSSVRVAARGPGLSLLNVDATRRIEPNPLREETARLRADVDRCQDAVQAIDDEDSAEQARLGFLDHLSSAAAEALARAVGFGRAGQDALAQMGDHLAESTASALARRRQVAASRRDAVRELEAAQERLDAAQDPADSAAFVVVSADLEASGETSAVIELTYHASRAHWKPLYDLTLRGEQLAVRYVAEVSQSTGEDWPAVALVLSTARGGTSQVLPELRPWYIGRVQPAVERGPMPPPAVAAHTATRVLAAGAAQAPQARAITALADQTASGQVFRVQRPLAVPADGGPHKTTVAEFEFDARLDHLAVPVMAAQAYIRATVTNSSSLLMLPGQARVFHDTEFAGSTTLPTVAAGEEFEVQLGVDDQIRVERELKRRATSKAVIGGTRTIDIGYEISVENHRQGQARVTVKDHIPVSTDGDIKVRLREAKPNPAEQSDLGELTWELALEPGQVGTITYRFTVEHPSQVQVSGLR